jgi:predicted site-specific integrase-resolvase
MKTPEDLITTAEARALLGVSPRTMARRLKDGTIRYYPNPLDRREKLVSKSEILALIPKRAEAA